MKLEAISMAATKAAAVVSSSAVLSQFGTSSLAVLMALIGVILAVLELEERTWREVITVVVLGLVVGVMGGALIVAYFAFVHPTALLLITFGVAYLSHDWIEPVKGAALERLLQRIKGRKS